MSVKILVSAGLAFVAGVATGAMAAGLYFKKQTQEYEEELREMFRKHMDDVSDEDLQKSVQKYNEVDLAKEKAKINQNKPDIKDYKRTVEQLDYKSFSAVNEAKNGLKTGNSGLSDEDVENSEENESEMSKKDPRPEIKIEDDEDIKDERSVSAYSLEVLNDGSLFAEPNGYDKVICTYYAENEVCINDEDDFVIDTSAWPGDFVDEFQDEMLWIRDNKLGIDYEITYNEGTYYDD